MLRIILVATALIISGCGSKEKAAETKAEAKHSVKKAASEAKFETYFNCLTNDFIFLGTAPGERWTKKEFQEFSKPFFVLWKSDIFYFSKLKTPLAFLISYSSKSGVDLNPTPLIISSSV